LLLIEMHADPKNSVLHRNKSN